MSLRPQPGLETTTQQSFCYNCPLKCANSFIYYPFIVNLCNMHFFLITSALSIVLSWHSVEFMCKAKFTTDNEHCNVYLVFYFKI